MHKIKVLHISPTYFSPDSVIGGGERYVDELVKALSDCCEVSLLSFANKKKSYITNHNVKVYIECPLFFIDQNKTNPLFINLFDYIITHDIIHVHQIHTVLTECVIILCRILGRPVVLTDHGGGGRTYLISRGLSKLADFILPVSEFSNKTLVNFNTNRKTIFGGVDTTTQLVRRTNSNKNLSIISIGRFLPHKGFHHLIEAVSRFENTELHLVGRVDNLKYFDYLNKLAKDKKVYFHLNLADQEIEKLKSNSDLAIFPSTDLDINNQVMPGRPELLGLAPLECMYQDIPTMVSDIGAYPEIALNSNFLFKHGNIEDLCLKIVNFKNHFKTGDFHQFVINKYTWDLTAKRCFEIYKKLIS